MNQEIGNKIADKITNASKKSFSLSQNDDANSEIKEKKRCIAPKERQQIIDELRLG